MRHNMSLENWAHFHFKPTTRKKSNMHIHLSGFSLTSRCTTLFHSAHILRHRRPCGRQTPVEIRQ